MSEELHLVTDLAVILVAAGVFTIISKALKQPLILGYIIAGFIVGPHLGMFPKLTSTEAVSQWSEIGIIFLLFSLGLEFSLKKLLKVGSAALIMAGTVCAGMFMMGIITGNALGGTMMESIFLGGMLSMSSTTIIIKAYDDLGIKDKPYAPLVFGTLVVEDLIAVLLMVLLSTMAVSNKFAGGEMLLGLAKLVFFLVLCFLVGIYLIPTLLKKAHKYLTDEILLLVSIGLCFSMVGLANLAGFSSALGAFLMGSILAATVESERIIKLVSGIKNLFGAIFFVSVGMMVDPAVIGAHWGMILVIALVAMAGILIFATAGGLLAGQGLDTALHAGFSLAQLGEFSFIIASLGCSLGVMRDFIYPVIITVSVITTFTTPYMIKAADPALAWLERKLPAKVLDRINPKNEDRKEESAAEKSEWKSLMKFYFLRIGIYGIILVAVILAMNSIFEPFINRILASWSEGARKLICCGGTLLAMSPFLYGLGINSGSIKKSVFKLLERKPSNRWPILSMILLRSFIAVAFVIIVITNYFTLSFWAILLLMVTGISVVIIGRRAVRRVSPLERRFMENLNEKENLEMKKKPVSTSVSRMMNGYDVHLDSIELSPDSTMAGKPLREAAFRHSSGANIIKIQRGSHSILIPGGSEILYPYDRILAVGTSAQLKALRESIAASVETGEEAPDKEFTVEKVQLDENSLYVGKSLREISMRKYGCMVISILRDGSLITNPGPDTVFKDGDIMWIAGEKNAVLQNLG